MSIEKITEKQLRRMDGKEGLILQGCGGDPQEWLDGINDMLTENGILRNGSRFKDCSVFSHDECTCILFPFDGADLDIVKLAMWRLQTHGQFGGTWLSDYVPNRLGGFITDEQSRERQKPDCPLIGQDGNIFNLMGIATLTLKRNGMSDEAKEMRERVVQCGSYEEALNTLGEYVNIVSIDEYYGCEEDDSEDYDEDEGEEMEMEGGMS